MDVQVRDESHSRYPLGFKDAIAAFFSPRLKISKESIRANCDYRLDGQTLKDPVADKPEKVDASAVCDSNGGR